MNAKHVICLAAMLLTWGADRSLAQRSVVGSPHDLSATSGPGRVHAQSEGRVCVFCHAPHNTSGQKPLWNRFMPPTHYRTYESSTIDARIDQPSGYSKLCLSCHDGALALGLLVSRGLDDPVVMSYRRIPPGSSDLTQDLSDDHPIGFRYDRSLYARDRQLKNPDLVSRELPLGRHNEMHCTTCHDAHDNSLGDFLRVTDVRSTICLSCHDMNGWRRCSHSLSVARVSGRTVDARDPLPYSTVADNACSNCHKIHSAGSRERLLRFRKDEDNCFSCHAGQVARANILSEMRKPSGHRVWRYDGRHEPDEDPRALRRHVECTDCHNPHAAAGSPGSRIEGRTLGLVSNALRFVAGVDRAGGAVRAARYEYEVCFKCHGDSASRTVRLKIPRQIAQGNVRLEFQTTNPSFHPVIGPRRNEDVVSLLAPWRLGSIVKCTDCHNSDSASIGSSSAPAGPHGSIYSPLLVANYSTAASTPESPRAYALCYRCHDRQSILGNESFPLHNTHVSKGKTPCSACHDPHGISRTQGGSGHSNLINFDRSMVQPASGGLGGRIEYEDRGRHAGSCTLTCHGVTHVRFEYAR